MLNKIVYISIIELYIMYFMGYNPNVERRT